MSGRVRLAPRPVRRGRQNSEAPPLPVLRDGELTLATLARYAEEYDEHGEGATFPAVAFVEYLVLEVAAAVARHDAGVAAMHRGRHGAGREWPPEVEVAAVGT